MTSPRLFDPPVNQDGRSKNARAQARHREKRKAYIRQLEDTLQRLQAAMSVSGETINSLPAQLMRVRDLERENHRLRSEVQNLRRHVSECLHKHNPESSPRKRHRSEEYILPRPSMGIAGTLQEDSVQHNSVFMTQDPQLLPEPHSAIDLVNDQFEGTLTMPNSSHSYQDLLAQDSNDSPDLSDYSYHDASPPPHPVSLLPKQEAADEPRVMSVQQQPPPPLVHGSYSPHTASFPPTPTICGSSYAGWAVQSAERCSIQYCA